MGKRSTLQWMRERMLSRIRIDEGSGCWIWTGSRFSDGYGQTSYRGRPLRAHRAALEVFAGVSGMLDKTNQAQALHSCDNPICVNPDHLFLGSPSDNMADRDAKGRQARGERCALARLSEDQVRVVRALWGLGMGDARIAQLTGHPPTTVHNITHRKTWKHVA